MDDFSIRVSTYLEKAIDIEHMKKYGFSVIETKSVPIIVNPSALCWSGGPTNYTDVQVDFDLRTADMFDDILEQCRDSTCLCLTTRKRGRYEDLHSLFCRLTMLLVTQNIICRKLELLDS